MNAHEIMQLKVVQLRDELRNLNLAANGRKDELRNRLLMHYQLQPIDDSEEEEENVADLTVRNNINHNVGSIGSSSSPILNVEPRTIIEKSRFTLRDIEDSLTVFTGSNSISVNDWIREFEENAAIVGWDEVQRYIYAKQLLRGASKLFIRSQSVNSWQELKKALKDEFGEKLTAVEVHRQLRNRRKQKNETLTEYLYSLAEIGNHVNLDEASLIEYFSDGVADSKLNKMLFYQSKTIKDLKDAIKTYERVGGYSQPLSRNNPPTEAYKNNVKLEKKEVQQKKHCFKCGAEGHLIRDCKNDDIKCFKCNRMGHKSYQCEHTQPSTDIKKTNANVMALTPGSMIIKDILCDGVQISALVDTGCEVCLLRNDILVCLGEVELVPEEKHLYGFAQGKITTLGSIVRQIVVDGISFYVKFHVVRESDMQFAAVLGNDVLSEVDILFKKKEAYFKVKSDDIPNKISSESNDDLNEFNVLYNAAVDGEFQTNADKKDVDLSHLNETHSKIIAEIINEYKPTKKYASPVEMKILVKDEEPVYQRARRESHEKQQWIEKQVADWLREGIIRPSISPYASPVVVVPKKNGQSRLCCDYRQINKKIVRDNYPMPLIDDVIERLHKSMVFTTLDLKDGFFHVPMEANSSKYTAFVTQRGQYEFNYAPFGICNSPAVFTRFITAVLRECINDGIVVLYMDDMVIPAVDELEGVRNLKRVLKICEQYNLHIKWKKCQFLVRCVTFLGYEIKAGTIAPCKEKLSAVTHFPMPTTRQAMQRFVGLTSYFRRFVKNFALIAKPLTDLLKKDAIFEIKEEHILTVKQLKIMLTIAPVLKLFVPMAETEIHTDACKYGYGGILLQRDSEDREFHPIQYYSRKTTPQEEKRHSYELEVLAVIEAVKKWRVYVSGQPFKIVTDCNAFKMTMDKKDVPEKIARWAMYLQQFQYVIEHRSGSQMRHADALSRSYCLMLEDSLRYRLREEQKKDDWLRAVRKLVENDIRFDDFYLKFDVLYKNPTKELIVVPTSMEEEIIRIAHNQGHYASKRTQEAVEQYYYIPSLARKVDQIIKGCVPCIITNAKSGKREGLLSPIDKSDQPLITYHLDHVGPMESTQKRYNHLLVVIDAFSKYVWLHPTKGTGTEEVIRSLEKQAVSFGNPMRVITDRGTAFTSTMFNDYCVENNIQHLCIATGVPRGNGQVERIHRIILPMIAKICHENPKLWYQAVGAVQQYLNNTPSRSTGATPFRILTGLHMRTKNSKELHGFLETEAIAELDEDRANVRSEAKANIEKIQAENKKSYDKNRKVELNYAIGDLVAIKRTQFGTSMKLRPKFLGPYKVVGVMNHGRYKVSKIGQQEGPIDTITVAENMKRWCSPLEVERQLSR